MNADNLFPPAEPQPRTVTYSLPVPPAVSWTAFDPLLARTRLKATASEIQFHLHSIDDLQDQVHHLS